MQLTIFSTWIYYAVGLIQNLFIFWSQQILINPLYLYFFHIWESIILSSSKPNLTIFVLTSISSLYSTASTWRSNPSTCTLPSQINLSIQVNTSWNLTIPTWSLATRLLKGWGGVITIYHLLIQTAELIARRLHTKFSCRLTKHFSLWEILKRQ